jgi:transcriptional regulator with XRE-family HTH domain
MALAQLDVEALLAALDERRRALGLTWGQVAREADISASTLSRMRAGKRPDVDGFASLVAWMEADADRFLVRLPEEGHDTLDELVGLFTEPEPIQDEYTGRVSEHVDDIVYGPVTDEARAAAAAFRALGE